MKQLSSHFIVLSAILLMVHCALAAPQSITFLNGDILTGTIESETPLEIVFKTAHFGTITIDKKLLAETKKEAKSDKPSKPEGASGARSQKGERDGGQGAPPEKGTEKKETTEEKETPKEKVSTQKKVTKKSPWSGNVGVSVSMRDKKTVDNSGNSSEDKYETYKFTGGLNWTGKQNALKWKWTYRYSRDDEKIRDDYFNVSQEYKHTFENKNLFASAQTLYQQDYNRRIENEYLQTAQLGIKWFPESFPIQITTSAGGGYHHYDRLNTDRDQSTSVSQPKFIFEESLRWEIIKSFAITQKYDHLGDLQQYHSTLSAGIENKLMKNLFIRLEYKLDSDTEVLYDDNGYSDRSLLTNLLYKF